MACYQYHADMMDVGPSLLCSIFTRYTMSSNAHKVTQPIMLCYTVISSIYHVENCTHEKMYSYIIVVPSWYDYYNVNNSNDDGFIITW